MFGADHVVEHCQMWGGRENGMHGGGAFPDFGGGRHSASLPYLLYDGARHWGKGDSSGDNDDIRGGPALYYANAIESTVAGMEMSAIGGKSAANLVTRRLGLIGPQTIGADRDEL